MVSYKQQWVEERLFNLGRVTHRRLPGMDIRLCGVAEPYSDTHLERTLNVNQAFSSVVLPPV